jgi:phage-related protein
MRKIIWIGSSRDDIKQLPLDVQDEVGYALYQAQLGKFPDYAKPLKGFKGVFEIISDFDKNTYRAVYATKLGGHLYVLHVFQKKSKTGIKTPKFEIELIRSRLQAAHMIAKGEL